MKRKILSAILASIIIFSVFPQTGSAADVDERSMAVDYVTSTKIFVGDANGNLNLESGLTRAELAVLLVRLRGDEETVKADIKNYSMDCYFTDVPEWAKPSVGYCAGEGLMVGYSLFSFGPNDKVTPQQACTVLLRHMGFPETDWSYQTAVSKATSTGITPADGFTDMAAIKRLEMAILIYKAETRGEGTLPDGNAGDGSTISPVPITSKVVDGTSIAREDFSQKANPAVFDNYYTRDIYNVIRQVMLDRELIAAGADENGFNPRYYYPHIVGLDQAYLTINTVYGNISAYHLYKSYAEPYVKNIWEYPSYSTATVIPWSQYMIDVDRATDAIISKASSMSNDVEKVQYFSDYLRGRIVYDENKKAGTLLEIFTSDYQVYGVCSTYSYAFQYLCEKAGIPVFYISGITAGGTTRHGWNMVYINGRWQYVDVTGNMILTSTYTFAVDENPKLTAFAKELLVPSSTK